MSFDPEASLLELRGPALVAGLFAAWWLAERWYRRRKRRPVIDGPEGEVYRVYTTEFDQELRAADIPARLKSASPDHARGWLETGDAAWNTAKINLHELIARQRDQLQKLVADAVTRLKTAGAGSQPDGMVVAILIDQSGSMRGAPIGWAAASAACVSSVLADLGARVEILGFSSAGWHGGRAFEKWRDAGRPKRPGRLCALMHVIYKGADDEHLTDDALNAIVHPDLLRENLDGEAILWARDRLLTRPEKHKYLIVVSDGAPVDDATLLHNGPSYLSRHLRTVIGDIEEEGRVTLGAIGIGYAVDKFYRLSVSVETAEALSGACVELLEAMMSKRRTLAEAAPIATRPSH